MILVDSNIIIDFWRTGREDYRKVFTENEICLSGIVKAELLHGARNKKDFTKIKHALAGFPMADFRQELWDDAGKLLYDLRISGIKVPFQDALLAVQAARFHYLIWSSDKHFELIIEALPEMKLFSVL